MGKRGCFCWCGPHGPTRLLEGSVRKTDFWLGEKFFLEVIKERLDVGLLELGFIIRSDLGIVLFQPKKLGWTPVEGPCHSGWSVSPDKDSALGRAFVGAKIRVHGAPLPAACRNGIWQPRGEGALSRCGQIDIVLGVGHSPGPAATLCLNAHSSALGFGLLSPFVRG